MKIFRYVKGEFNLEERPLIAGIVNVTPDSFSDGGLFLETDNAVREATERLFI